MAQIDFPAAPVVNQIFAAGGINYQWNGTLWLAVGGYVSPSPGGDVSAVNGTAVQNNGVPQVITFSGAVVVGNAGSWLNLATGRYTPPAGKYYLSCSMSTQAPVGGNGTWALALRKNGTQINSITGSGSASFAIPLTSGCEVDANGTDFFDFVSGQQAAGMNSQGNATFTAFPLSGIKGPPGDPGQLGFRLLQRTVVSSAVSFVEITGISSDINDLKFHFDLTPATNAVDLGAFFYDNVGVLDNTVGHYAWSSVQTFPTIASGASPFGYGSTTLSFTGSFIFSIPIASARISNSGGIRGSGNIQNIAAARIKNLDFQSNYMDEAGAVSRAIVGSGWRGIATAITGLRLQFSSGNIASGAFSVWGSP